VQEKNQKEIEEQRKKKMNRIIGKSEMAENSELDTVNILDILDPASGIYTHGGSLTELSLMLTAFEK